MANQNHTFPRDHRGTYDALWRQFYAISGCLAGASVLAQNALSDSGTYEARDSLSGLLVALEKLAVEGERMAADARESVGAEG